MIKEVVRHSNADGSLTDQVLMDNYILCVQVFAQVASKNDLEKGITFDLGKRLFDESIASIKRARKTLSE